MNNRDIIRAEAELDMLKDKAKETDMLAKENLELRSRINKAIEYLEMCKNFALVDKKIILSVSTIEQILKGADKPRKGEVVSLEELESYEPKNNIEEEYYDEMWSR